MYDNVCKFMAEMFSEDFADWLIGSPISLTELKPTELSLEPIRADSVIFLQSDDLVLHIEFQTAPDPEIPYRMADYCLRVYRKFPQKRLHQVVIYLRKTDSPLVRQDTFTYGRLTHRFNLIRLWEQATAIFLEKPGLLPFAVLTQTEQPTKVLTEVGTLINQIEQRRKQSNISASTAILAGLVLKQNIISRILRSDIMRESVVYQEILAEGRAEGEAKGRAEGKAEGIKEGKAEGKAEGIKEGEQRVAMNLLRVGMNIDQVAKLTELTLEEVEALHEQLNGEIEPELN